MIRLALLLIFGIVTQALAGDLALKRVMLSSGGVGYFEYAAEVDGDATLGLDVPLGQVDDILKSLVVFDSAGAIAGVELPGRDNTVEAFGDAPFGPEALDSPAAYLNALRGTEVSVQGPRPMTGRLMRAEPVTETNGTASSQRTRITVLGADGMRQFVLEDADTVQVTDPALRARIARALEALRADASLTIRHLTIRLKGKGQRTVAVGYVAGAPLWKATYRLMLQPAPAQAARLQGWATLENQSGADWRGVALTLQYGNPVTFRQSLYRSYFVQRPEVPIEILGKILPDIDSRARVDVQGMMAPAGAAMPLQSKVSKSMASPPSPPLAPGADAAQAEETGEETVFTLVQPVDLAAGHTANVPIIDRDVPAQRIGLVPFFRAHPLAAIRIKNDDSRSLPAGVLTIYDTGHFAGDARLGGLPAGEARLLPFAQDLRTAIDRTDDGQTHTIIGFSVAQGVMTYTLRARQTLRFTITGPAKESRDLLLEIPKANAEQTLTFEDPKTRVTEQTATAYRVAISLTQGETRIVTARLELPVRQTVALVNGDSVAIQAVIGTESLNQTGRDALRHVLDLRRDEARLNENVTAQGGLLDGVQADEDRIRKNLGAVAASDALRSRLTKALDADETKIEQLRTAIDVAKAEVVKAHRALTDAVAALKI